MKTIGERFWEKVDKDGPEVRPGLGKCWLWTGSKHEQGYGRMKVGGSLLLAHRLAWELSNGEIPDGLDVLHACDNPACVRHLFIGTHQDNMTDMVRKKRSASGARNGRYTHPERTARGARHGRGSAKLNEESVLQIRREHKAGELGKNIAVKHGVTPQLVSLIVRRLAWAHLPEEG